MMLAMPTVAFLGGSLVAMLDKWHQSCLNSRPSKLRDALLDSGAALAGQITVFVMQRIESFKWGAGRDRRERKLVVGDLAAIFHLACDVCDRERTIVVAATGD